MGTGWPGRRAGSLAEIEFRPSLYGSPRPGRRAGSSAKMEFRPWLYGNGLAKKTGWLVCRDGI